MGTKPMWVRDQVVEDIQQRKKNRPAIILAHHYQDSDIQEIADYVGDSLDLVRHAEHFDGQVIVLCGAKFIAESVKLANPKVIVLIPDKNAGCSLVDSCPVAAIKAFKKRNPNHVIVSYINTSAEVKAESDMLCTAQNAVKVVNSIPAHRPVLFLPDINLGNWVQKQTGRKNMTIWQGACIVHATFLGRRLAAARSAHPQAAVAAHPECPDGVLRQADFVGSPSSIIDWCAQQVADEFIVMMESGVRYSLEKQSPGKKFYFVANENCNCSECPYMKMNTLEKLRDCLGNLEPRIELPPDVIERARVPLARMLALK